MAEAYEPTSHSLGLLDRLECIDLVDRNLEGEELGDYLAEGLADILLLGVRGCRIHKVRRRGVQVHDGTARLVLEVLVHEEAHSVAIVEGRAGLGEQLTQTDQQQLESAVCVEVEEHQRDVSQELVHRDEEPEVGRSVTLVEDSCGIANEVQLIRGRYPGLLQHGK